MRGGGVNGVDSVWGIRSGVISASEVRISAIPSAEISTLGVARRKLFAYTRWILT